MSSLVSGLDSSDQSQQVEVVIEFLEALALVSRSSGNRVGVLIIIDWADGRAKGERACLSY